MNEETLFFGYRNGVFNVERTDNQATMEDNDNATERASAIPGLVKCATVSCGTLLSITCGRRHCRWCIRKMAETRS
jgi:hypothetical protein